MLTQARLKEMLHYEPTTGIFMWLKAPGQPKGARNDLVGAVAGVRTDENRILICLDYVRYKAHRLAVFYMTGVMPALEVDHRDGNSANNRWVNLREVTPGVNQQNQRKAHKDSVTGFLGVVVRGKKFRAVICVNRKRYMLGTFNAPEEAHAAYVAAKRKMHEGCTI